MHKLKIITIIILTTTMNQISAMNLENCCCLKLFFGYTYSQKEREYLESLKGIEALNRGSITLMLDPLSSDQLKRIKSFIEQHGGESSFPKLYSLTSNVAYFKDLEDTAKTLTTPPFLTMRPMTRENIRRGYHPGVLLMR